MIALRLVHLIEQQSDELAGSLTQKILSSDRTKGLREISASELHQRCHEIYRHLSEWVLNKTEPDIQSSFAELGERAAARHAPLADLTWALILTKENLLDFLRHEGTHHSAQMVWGELELLRSIDQFFDRAIYHVTVAYEAGSAGATHTAEVAHGSRMVDSLFAAAAFRSPLK